MKQNNTTDIPKPIKNYLNYMKAVKGVSSKTIREYRLDLISFFRFYKINAGLIEDYESYQEITIDYVTDEVLNDIEIDDIYAYLTFLEEERNNKNSTRARKIACLKSFFNFNFLRRKILDKNISMDLEFPKQELSLPIYLTKNEANNLIKSVNSRNQVRDMCIIALFLNTGLRLSELCSIDINDLENEVLIIKGKGNKERAIYLNTSCKKYIAKYLEERAEKMKGYTDIPALFISERRQRISPRTVEASVKNAILNAGLSNKYSVHKLRHTAATYLHSEGIDIRTLQIMLGHSNISTTQVYTHVNENKIKDAFNVADFGDD